MKIASQATPEGLAGHMWPAGHGLSTTALRHWFLKIVSFVISSITFHLEKDILFVFPTISWFLLQCCATVRSPWTKQLHFPYFFVKRFHIQHLLFQYRRPTYIVIRLVTSFKYHHGVNFKQKLDLVMVLFYKHFCEVGKLFLNAAHRMKKSKLLTKFPAH